MHVENLFIRNRVFDICLLPLIPPKMPISTSLLVLAIRFVFNSVGIIWVCSNFMPVDTNCATTLQPAGSILGNSKNELDQRTVPADALLRLSNVPPPVLTDSETDPSPFAYDENTEFWLPFYRNISFRRRHRRQTPAPINVRPVKTIRVRETDYRQIQMQLGSVKQGPNTETYNLSEPNRWINVTKDGALIINEPLDYEALSGAGVSSSGSAGAATRQVRFIRFDVRAFDAKTGVPTAIQPVTVEVEDVNDERPYFINAPRPFQAVVPLDAVLGQPVYKFEAIDPDQNSKIEYRLFLDRSGNDMFDVNPSTGEVVVKRAGRFKMGEEYRISVRAEDVNAQNQQFTEEEILSIKGGERAPQFYAGLYEISVPENKEVKSKITQVKALSFNNKPLRYEITGDGNETFRIDSITGDLFLEKPLDYDDLRNPRNYYLSLFAREENNGLSSSVRLHITIEDNNDNTPKFQFPSQQVYVNEDVAKGQSVATVSAYDADSGQNGAITFHILNNENFTINTTGDNKNAAIIRVVNPAGLDADHGNREYKLIVVAVDKGQPARTGTAMVRVFARNTNDERPVFTQSMYHATIQEDAQQGMTVATVTATDVDGDKVEYGFADTADFDAVGRDALVNDGQNSLLRHTSFDGLFTIDKDNGVIQLARSNSLSAATRYNLDQAKYVLKVIAVDDGSCCRGGNSGVNGNGNGMDNDYQLSSISPLNSLIRHTAEATVVVSVIDVNDHKPVFVNCTRYLPRVRENADPGTYVTTMYASDEDSGANGQVEYEIETFHDQPKMFTIDPITGVVKTLGIFDREASGDVMITVLARDKGYRPLVGGCSFKIELEDVNDNAPVFERELYEFTLKQDTPPGRFRSVRAVDRDVGVNAEVEYTLQSDSQQALDLFGIDNDTGWLYTKRPIPATPKDYRLQAVATDRGQPNRLWNKVPIVVRITDVNSRPPVWISPSPDVLLAGIELNETAARNTHVITVKAKSDLPQNKHIYYELLDGRTPATNSEKHFILQRYKDEQREDAAILRVYKSLDYEHVPFYNLTIQAKNDLDPQLDSILYLPVRLVDQNDEVPLFPSNPVLTILEGEPENMVVGTVRAEDADATPEFNRVQYFPDFDNNGNGPGGLLSDWRFFDISPDGGEITSRASFDREQRASYTLAVLAQDSAPSDVPGVRGPNQNTVYVRIEIADKNDNAPYFERAHYTAAVKESAMLKEPVLTVAARDADESPRLVYQIVGGNINGAFAIHPSLGTITVNGELDFESLAVDGRPARYDLDVAVSDGAFSNRTRVTIMVEDVNDMPPEFPRKLYETAVKEEDSSALPKFLPLNLVAIDGDRMRNDKIRYSLVGQGAGDEFVIPDDTEGRIQITKALDRDAPRGQPEWTFTVLAKDEDGKGLTGFADVKVKLIDVNDNDPFFEDRYLIGGQVRENSPVGTRVMKISATDYDDPNVPGHADLTYDIYQNVHEPATARPIFELDGKTGLITTAWAGLDREAQDLYTIVVRATDGGGRVGTGTATIKILDENDSRPKFLQRRYETTIEEIASAKLLPDAPILTVEVEDADLNNDFVFGIVTPCDVARGEYGCDKFHVDAEFNGAARGLLYVVKQLDYENEQDRRGFNFRIFVNDHGTKRAPQDFAEISVRLIDINDNAPKFRKQNDAIEEYEDVAVGKSLAQFTATDADREGRSLVRYAIARETDPLRQFNVSEDGVVRVQRPLDREMIETHFVEILAIDDGTPPLTSTATLTVKLKDVNDNAPYFAFDYRPVLMESAPAGTFIAEVTARDPDTGDYNGAPFRFETPIPNPTQDDFELRFRANGGPLGQGSAQIFSKRIFDREKQKEFYMPIIISDRGQMAGTSTLTITIGDINDHLMEAGEKHITVYNYRGKMPDAHVGRVHVEDLDDWDLPDKTFTWHDDGSRRATVAARGNNTNDDDGGGKPEQFDLDRTTGMLTMRRGTRAGRYSFKVDVREDGPPGTKQVTSSVIVTVKDVTDEALKNSGSVRLSGISAEDFIRQPASKNGKSLYEIFRQQLQKITKAKIIEIFSVITQGGGMDTGRPLYTDLRYSAQGSPFYKATMLNGKVLVNRRAIEAALPSHIKITMAPIDLCGSQEACATDGCYTRTYVEDLPTLVNANTTALVGVTVQAERVCGCEARDFSQQESCGAGDGTTSSGGGGGVGNVSLECFNGGECVYDWDPNPYCRCPRGFDGPRCQQTTRSFNGKGWAWLPPLGTCEQSHLSFEFTTYTRNGLLLYNGPLSAELDDSSPSFEDEGGMAHSAAANNRIFSPADIAAFYQSTAARRQQGLSTAYGSGRGQLSALQAAALEYGQNQQQSRDFLAVELNDGKLRVHVDFGSGEPLVLELPTTSTLADSSWHRVDLFWDKQQVKVQLDNCRAANISDPGDRIPEGWHQVETCEISGRVPGFYYQLNVNQPLQLGGSAVPVGDKRGFNGANGFRGCIRNLVHNGVMYDLQAPGDSEDSQPGCPEADKQCFDREGKAECVHGLCDANLLTYRCVCEPGHRGSRCQYATKEMSFDAGSFIQYDLRDNLQLSPLFDDVQLRFRTRSPTHTTPTAVSQLFYMGSASGGEYLALEIRNHSLQLRYDLNGVLAEEYFLNLPNFWIDDGRWHTAKVERFGADAYLTVDKGDGRRYAELIAPAGVRHKALHVKKQNVFAGGQIFNGNYNMFARSGSGPRLRTGNGYENGGGNAFGRSFALAETETGTGSETGNIPRGSSDGNGLSGTGNAPSGTFGLTGIEGGSATGTATGNVVVVTKDFIGCLDDIRINGRYLPLDKTNDDQTYAEIVQQQNLTEGCSSRSPCAENPLCPTPMVCVDIWREHECRCPPGFQKKSAFLSSTGIAVGGSNVDTCVDLDECEEYAANVCLNGGMCENIVKTNKFDKGPGFICHCPLGYTGQNCGALRGEQRLGVAHSVFWIMFGCLALLLACVLIAFLTYNRQRRRRRYDDKAGLTVEPDDDIRENIVAYNEEGAGEEDVRAYDITPLRVPIRPSDAAVAAAAQQQQIAGTTMPFYAIPSKMRGQPQSVVSPLSPQQQQLTGELINIPGNTMIAPYGMLPMENIADIEDFLARRLDEADNDPMAPPYDELRTYAYEGSGSRSISLSSLNTVGDEDLNFEFVRSLGPKFQNLAQIYSTDDDNDDEGDVENLADYSGDVIVASVEDVENNNNHRPGPSSRRPNGAKTSKPSSSDYG